MRKRRAPRRGPAGDARHGVARWLSKYGLASRTEAERLVRAGRVAIDGRRALDPDAPCHPERHRITLDGEPIRKRAAIVLALHKPAGCITTARDPEGRPTVYDLVPAELGVQAVGRLDADSTGLLLLTNDSDVAAAITDSRAGIEKTYEVALAGAVGAEALQQFESGLVLDGRRTRPARARVLERGGDRTRVEVVITEGRNRQVRRMWELLGHRVLELHRTRIGCIALGDLAPGATRSVAAAQWKRLLR